MKFDNEFPARERWKRDIVLSPKRLKFYFQGRTPAPVRIGGGQYLEVMVVDDRPRQARPWWMTQAAKRLLLSLN